MSPRRRVGLMVFVTIGLAIVSLAFLNHPLRIRYHRWCLYRDLSFNRASSKNRDYLEWLSSARTSSRTQRERRDLDAQQRVAALERLGYYVRHQYVLNGINPQGRDLSVPDWLTEISIKVGTDAKKAGDLPLIEFRPSSSNTLLVQIIGPPAVVNEFAAVIQKHEDQ